MQPHLRVRELQLVTLVITTCTNRKRRPINDTLRVSALRQAPIAEVAFEWGARISAATDLFPAREIYGGRAFQEALLAANLLNAQLLVVSAGLGLISADDRVPPYACTVLVNAPDSVSSRVVGDYSVAEWWQAIGEKSPFSKSLKSKAASPSGLICAALSEAYIDMIAGDLCAMPTEVLARLRLFTRAPVERVAPTLRPFVMPYDDRLDGPDSPVRGTRSDFAGRALHHFAEFIIRTEDSRSAAEHAAAVVASLLDWRMVARADRQRFDDVSILNLIHQYWDAENGSTTRLLRRFRDDLSVACEQRRFAALVRQVRAERT